MYQLLTYGLLIALGFLPSLFWLFLYLRKDLHPEPKYLLTRTFFMGLVLAFLAVIGQWILSQMLIFQYPSINIGTSSLFFLGAAFIEEYVKFLAVKFVVLHDPEFDEPLDAMIYMITASLGFAAIENILVLFQAIPNGASAAAGIWLYRFAGATFLHALSSAVTGYFLSLAWFYHKHSGKLIALGLILGTVVHFIFNSIILHSSLQALAFTRSSIFLALTALIISLLFSNIRRREEHDGCNYDHAPEISTGSAYANIRQ